MPFVGFAIVLAPELMYANHRPAENHEQPADGGYSTQFAQGGGNEFIQGQNPQRNTEDEGSDDGDFYVESFGAWCTSRDGHESQSVEGEIQRCGFPDIQIAGRNGTF